MITYPVGSRARVPGTQTPSTPPTGGIKLRANHGLTKQTMFCNCVDDFQQ
ncbi:hypothetical protein RM533_12005 [Croceicoccus sp. F390]|uniref:Uncharacterized protein n=1 Tax=Croceicoccus esteveae TaxID=3075597 RepID=A0ABU2ZJW1_9SPHN|nr:hypothetical protein [Croceicoccus sp. F390]MDT0576894.1 hypothetical protein [Croceicoccus sp. F390]